MGNNYSEQTPKAQEFNKIIDGTDIHVSSACEDGEPKAFIYDEGKTIYEAFLRGEKISNNGPFLGRRTAPDGPYEWLTYKEISEMADAFGAGLLNECDLQPSNDTYIGIFSQNRVEWVVCDQATARFSMVLVPLYNTLGKEAVTHILNETELSVVVCDNQEKIETLLEEVEHLTHLKHLVVMESVTDELKERVLKHDLKLHLFEDLIASGKASPKSLTPAKPDDVCTISYTSGTTGVPKGVVITHKSVLVAGHSAIQFFKDINVHVVEDDVFISYLPLTHIFEKYNLIVCMMVGSKMGFFSGNILKLVSDIQELKPTILPAVPRLLYKIYDRIYTGASQSFVKKRLLDWAVSSKLAALDSGNLRNDTMWDKLVFNKIRAVLGGRVRHIGTGGAATSPEVLRFFRVALHVTLCVGYGQTELSGPATASLPFDNSFDHVGVPLVSNMVKLVDVPDMGYYAKDDYGEVCVKGPNQFKEYFKQPEKTAETIDTDGWVHTGDIGHWTPEGNLQIVDRCKHIFKLSQGEYIAPEKIEGVYTCCRHVAQIFVDGHSDKDYLVAIIVPDFEALERTLSKKVEPEEICKDSEVEKLILDEMTTFGKEKGLKGFEIVKRLHLHPDAFTPENGLLTVSMKSRRNELRKRFAEQVTALYTVEEK